ncbi:MAG: hypothetical protein VX000_00370, partial [Myxococcota bacterium]|nr:hypothetical protein [Myxococcota bacterium]
MTQQRYVPVVAFCASGLAALVGLAPRAALAGVCGDGVLDSGETCDDGNATAGDGCDASCQEEFGWECVDATFELDFAEVVSDDGHPSPSWSLSSDRLTVTQSLNADAAVYMSNLPATGTEISVDLTVNTTGDDDFIGFVLGYESGENASSSGDWLLFDWKQGDQDNGCSSGADGGGASGTRLSRVSGVVGGRDMWCHEGAVSELASGSRFGSTGWSDHQTYEVRFECNPTRLDIEIDGTLEFSETGTFDCGNFGFYNYSQSDIEYELVDPVGVSICGELDTDGDGLTDATEDALGTDYTSADSDGDGLDDYAEVGDPEAPTDSDGDGVIDAIDADDDGDGVDTAAELLKGDSDGDGTADYLDVDDDGDGVDTIDEVGLGDTDGDGVDDYLDTDDDGDGLDTSTERVVGDTDGDGTADYLDVDDDGDGVDTIDEVGLGDTDGDGVDDYLDADDDGDGVSTSIEVLEGDTDGDGTEDYLDADVVGDGVSTDIEVLEGDTDGDGAEDYLDVDDDG